MATKWENIKVTLKPHSPDHLHVPSENQPSASPDVRGMRFGTWRNSNPEPQFAQPKPGDDATLLRVVTCIAS
jgi:hypothetical protein